MDEGVEEDRASVDGHLAYRLCPRCARAVPVQSAEHYCINDGTRLLDGCPACGAPIASPYSRFCGRCGGRLGPDLSGPGR